MILTAFHTQGRRTKPMTFPALAEGSQQWLGDGFYFWQDYEFADWWGQTMKCPTRPSVSDTYDIYTAEIEIDENNFLDTVFNMEAYYLFVEKIEKFARKYTKVFHRKPSLIEFNDFISDFGLWKEIEVIRFQDVPKNDELVEVSGFYYKKRIQIRVNNSKKIANFTFLENLYCV